MGASYSLIQVAIHGSYCRLLREGMFQCQLVPMRVCFSSVMTWNGTAQKFITAVDPDTSDLAKCHKGLLTHNINALKHRIAFILVMFLLYCGETYSSFKT